MKSMQRVSAFWAAGVSLAAAMSVSAGVIRHDVSDSAYLNLGASSDYASVGFVTGSTPDFNFSASGTLIDNNWVLTAGHVVSDASALSFKLGGTTFVADQWVAHNKWDGDLGKGYDIGLMHFTTDLTAATGIGAAQRYTGSDELGEIATFAGYGTTGTGLTGWTTFDGQKRAGQNVIDRYLRTPGRTSRVLLSDFDNPLDPSDSRWDPDTPLALEYLIAPGDSGGGMFLDIGGQQLLAGVHSFLASFDGLTDADYGDISGVTRVSEFNKWIDGIIGGGGGGGGGKGGGNNGKGGGRPTLVMNLDTALTAAIVPEPASLSLLAGGLVLALRRRR